MLDFSQFQIITFDCYGTLIDWESGILKSVRAAFPGLNATDAEVLAGYSEVEPLIQSLGYMKYRQVLRQVLMEMGNRFSQKPTDPDAIANSLGDWQPFPDTVAALERLKQRYKLAIISNIDDDLFAQTARHLKVPFDQVITAEQVGSYKPTLRNFEVALERIALPKEAVLHAAESLYHDVAPARQLGIANVWVNRRGNKPAAASKSADVKPDLEVADLKSLADLM